MAEANVALGIIVGEGRAEVEVMGEVTVSNSNSDQGVRTHQEEKNRQQATVDDRQHDACVEEK